MSTQSPKISIIVPVYKVEQYLPKCIDSILSQTYPNWELLLIDDGSPDNSGKICDEYAQKDERIRVFHKENGGVSGARNWGLEYSTGEWITFVDSDDCLYAQTLEILLAQVLNKDLDLIQCYFSRTLKEESKYYTSTEVLSGAQYANSESYLTCVWGALYKTPIIRQNKLCFNLNVKLGEDQIFLLNYMQYCSRVQRIGNILYFYRDNENSAVHNTKPEYELVSVKAFKDLKQNNPIASKRCDSMLLNWFVSLSLSSEIPVCVIKDLYSDVKIDYCSYRTRFVSKLAFYLLKINVSLAVVLLRTLHKLKKI